MSAEYHIRYDVKLNFRELSFERVSKMLEDRMKMNPQYFAIRPADNLVDYEVSILYNDYTLNEAVALFNDSAASSFELFPRQEEKEKDQ